MARNHSFIHTTVLAGILIAGLCVSQPARSQVLPTDNNADNSRANKKDKTEGAVTADQQKNNRTDRRLAQQIRKSVMADKSLSTDAHNVKIVAQNGTVDLKGPVRSEDEKKTVVAKAEEAAGPGKVTDELTIAPPK